MADCDTRPDATSYLVVLQDFTGTARTFTLDMAACSEMYGATRQRPVAGEEPGRAPERRPPGRHELSDVVQGSSSLLETRVGP